MRMGFLIDGLQPLGTPVRTSLRFRSASQFGELTLALVSATKCPPSDWAA